MQRQQVHLKIPAGIWALGFVSLFMDASSELIHSLLPIFMVSTLGLSVAAVGFIEGFAEATALFTKVFSGVLSDYFRKRKALTVIGYGLSAVTKPFFPLANTLTGVLVPRLIDRLGKGIRGSPRDALIGELAPKEIRGACFGLRQSMDTVGAVIGPFLAIVAMAAFGGEIRAALWVAFFPAVISVAILWFAVKEPEVKEQPQERFSLKLSDLTLAGTRYWSLVLIGGVLSLGRFSEGFLLLKSSAIGLSPTWVPLVMIVMNVVYALSAYPAGALSDKFSRKTLLMAGIGLLIAADICLGYSGGVGGMFFGIAFWGLHLGLTQGLFAAMIADATTQSIRATAYGIFNMVAGVSLLAASVIAGILWDVLGPKATFLAGAGFAAAALLLLLIPKKAQKLG